MQGQYDMLSDNLPDGIFYDKQNRKIVFKKECSSKLESKEQDASTYSYEVSVTDNLDKKVTVTSTLEVTPVFTVVVPEGGVWTNRATIQVVEDVKYSKSYQLKVGEKWQDYSDATITGLQPNTTYTVRALVNNWPTTEATFTTEEAFQIPDGGFDKEWTKDVIDAVSTGIGDAIGLIGRVWTGIGGGSGRPGGQSGDRGNLRSIWKLPVSRSELRPGAVQPDASSALRWRQGAVVCAVRPIWSTDGRAGGRWRRRGFGWAAGRHWGSRGSIVCQFYPVAGGGMAVWTDPPEETGKNLGKSACLSQTYVVKYLGLKGWSSAQRSYGA